MSPVPRPPWLHDAFASPHVLQFLNLNAAAAANSMLAASQPLAALHSMAERSQQQQQQQQQQQGSPTGSGKHSPATSITSVGSNPHGIDTILSRPPPQQQQGQQGGGGGSLTSSGTAQQQQQQVVAAVQANPRYAMHAGFAAAAAATGEIELTDFFLV
ncbi:hypothetical protein QAD02_017867 [Eretmocerus hayati]|uniref:Uncharacterized protein n=1 Tax=Eretmocerus hayati TaxID=131215 RepID=A0ACC2PES9_9HYME|nr:hypothetical protein QAD02_017867 [Eretmocerus hayati]